jgi:acyl carrier protein
VYNNRVFACVADVTGVDVSLITVESTVTDLGADELDIMEIDVALEEEFGIELDDASFLQVQTVADMVAMVEAVL